MKKFRITLIIMIILLGQVSNMAYAIEGPLDNLPEKYDLLREENIRLREEILKLRNQLSEKPGEKIPVLMYHHLLMQEDIDNYNWSKNSSVLSVESFEEQMDYLHENGFYTATLDELNAFMDGKISLPEKTVVITFDDGYLSNALYAYPIMKKYNFRGTIFMIGYRVDAPQEPFDPSATQALSVNETYKYRDVFDYESHTYALHNMDKDKKALILAKDKKEIIDDLTKNRELLNAKYLAYPYGKYDENTIEYLKDTGHEMAFTIEAGYTTKDLNKFMLPRFEISSQRMPFSRFMRVVNGMYE